MYFEADRWTWCGEIEICPLPPSQSFRRARSLRARTASASEAAHRLVNPFQGGRQAAMQALRSNELCQALRRPWNPSLRVQAHLHKLSHDDALLITKTPS